MTDEQLLERNRKYCARRREWLRTQGLCRKCGKVPAMDSYTLCRTCLDKTEKWAKERYDRLKASGMCPHCGKPKRPERFSCDDCLAKQREKEKSKRLFYKSVGICPICGRNRIYIKGRVLCEECAAKQAGCAERYRRKNTEKTRECAKKVMHRLWDERRAAGLCPKCGGELEPGYKTCLKCRIKSREWSRGKREKERLSSGVLSQKEKREKGICLRCGKPTGGIKAYCPECLGRMSERMTEWHRKKREEEAAHNTP